MFQTPPSTWISKRELKGYLFTRLHVVHRAENLKKRIESFLCIATHTPTFHPRNLKKRIERQDQEGREGARRRAQESQKENWKK